jgi:uncharacterized Zn finger protein (UPF0148 family)
MASSRDETSKKIGAKLLSGWKMLGDSCPTCYSPLMSPRGSNDKMCVVCETPPAARAPVGAPSPALPAPSPRAATSAGAGASAFDRQTSVPLAGARILSAPAGWESMSPEELRAAASLPATGAGAPARAAAPPAPRDSSPSPSGSVRLSAAQGNVGPRPDGRVTLLPSLLVVPEPGADEVARLVEGLRRADEDAAAAVALTARVVHAPSVPESTSTPAPGWARTVLERARIEALTLAEEEEEEEEVPAAYRPRTTAMAAEVPSKGHGSTASAIAGLKRALDCELAAITRLSAPGMVECSGAALAAAAGRTAKLIDGLTALERWAGR